MLYTYIVLSPRFVFNLHGFPFSCVSSPPIERFVRAPPSICVATIQAGNVFQIRLTTESVGPAAKSADVGAQQSCQLNGKQPSEYTTHIPHTHTHDSATKRHKHNTGQRIINA